MKKISHNSSYTGDDSRLYNDIYAEWDSYQTILAVRDALDIYHDVTLIEADQDAYLKLRENKPDIVFNIAEGMHGISREAQIPAMLDMLNIPYTGSDPLTLATCLDKSRAKEILLYNGIKTPKFLTVSNLEEASEIVDQINLSFPVIVKPIAEGSSKGIFNSSFCQDKNILIELIVNNIKTYQQPVIIEEYLPGREFTVAIIGNAKDINVLPIVEINFSHLPKELLPIYSYEAKWIADKRENPLDIFSCPAQISPEVEEKIGNTAIKAFNTLRCRDWSRIDIRLDAHGEPNIIEINPLPGILPDPADNSCFPKAARAQGMTYAEMINNVLNAAWKRISGI